MSVISLFHAVFFRQCRQKTSSSSPPYSFSTSKHTQSCPTPISSFPSPPVTLEQSSITLTNDVVSDDEKEVLCSSGGDRRKRGATRVLRQWEEVQLERGAEAGDPAKVLLQVCVNCHYIFTSRSSCLFDLILLLYFVYFLNVIYLFLT